MYQFVLYFTIGLLKLIAPFHKKIGQILEGQNQQIDTIKHLKNKSNKRIWIHAASLGEYEMAIPLIQKINQTGHNVEFILSFFSPSGYKNAKIEPNCSKFYLPFDTQKNVKFWYDTIQPDSVIFVKYEIWPIFLNEAHARKIPVWFWNFALRNNHFILNSWAQFWKKSILPCAGFYCSNETTVQIANNIGLKNAQFLGDIRYLRTKNIQENLSDIPQKMNDFTQNSSVLILGSSWETEEKALALALSQNPLKSDQRIIIAPHNIATEHVAHIESLFKHYKTYTFSGYEGQIDANILIIDNIGILSKLYALADVAVIGGAFGNGLHNIIEAAAAGVPVLFGPNTKKFPEAQDFVDAKIGFQAKDMDELESLIVSIWMNSDLQEMQKIKSQTLAFFAKQIPDISLPTNTILMTK